jgi:hypothetical protein
MAPEESRPDVEQPAASGSPESPRREPSRHSRHSRGRGRGRGRGQGRKQPAPSDQIAVPAAEQLPFPEVAASPDELQDESAAPEAVAPTAPPPPASASERMEAVREQPTAAPLPARPPHPAAAPSVEQAIDDVNQIIETLKNALEDMEELLEMLELFERQSLADEREIDSLRRALRQLQRPRGGGPAPRGRS